jgi:DNA-binding MarR family transcriptional regulator
LSVTEKGMKKLFESYEAIGKIRQGFLACFTSAERKELVKLLEQLEKYLSIKLTE